MTQTERRLLGEAGDVPGREVERGERSEKAQLAREIEIASPRELSKAEAIRLVRDFVQEQFVARGMVADLNVHWTVGTDGEVQPHTHVMLTMRRVEAGRSVLRDAGEPGEAMQDEKPMSEQILDEAQGAHETSREILALMWRGKEAEDLIRMILDRLDAIRGTQVRMLVRLDAIEQHLRLRD